MPLSTLLSTLSDPAAAFAGGAAHGAACEGSGMGGAALLAAVAALGWTVLRFAYKESGTVKTAGQAVGWLLLVGGTAGFLCGAVCHAFSRRAGWPACGHETTAWSSPSMTETSPALPPGHPPIGKSKEAPGR